MIKILSIALFTASLIAASGKPAVKSKISEDAYILFALDAQAHQKHQLAAGFFSELYKQTGKKEYLYQSLRMLEQSNDTKKLMSSTANALKESPDDTTLKRFEIIALLKSGQFAEGSQKALMLSNATKEASDYLLYADSRIKLSDYSGATRALKNAYDLTYDESTAERIALIEYTQLDEKEEAVQFLKDHIGAQGNSTKIGKRLASFYADQSRFDDAASMYEQTYAAFGDASTAEEAIKVYAYQQNLPKMTELLEKSHINDPLLLDLYVKAKQFPQASKLAQTLYEQENNPLYLAQSAVFKYEGASDRNDPLLLTSVIEGLKKANADLDEPLYLNYLGYLMIDHDVNVSEGMDYVRRALEKQPDSPFYIDSLAWGNYKLGKCAEALRLIKQVESMIGTDEDEVRDHLKAIEQCKTKEKQ